MDRGFQSPAKSPAGSVQWRVTPQELKMDVCQCPGGRFAAGVHSVAVLRLLKRPDKPIKQHQNNNHLYIISLQIQYIQDVLKSDWDVLKSLCQTTQRKRDKNKKNWRDNVKSSVLQNEWYYEWKPIENNGRHSLPIKLLPNEETLHYITKGTTAPCPEPIQAQAQNIHPSPLTN